MKRSACLFFVAVVAMVACGDGGSTPPVDPGLDAVETGYPDGQEEAAEIPAGAGVLRFVDQTDDAGKNTATASIFTLMLPYNGARDLKVKYLVDGKPVAQAAITFQMIDPDNKALCSLAGLSVFTDEDGVASDKISVVKEDVGQFQVKVCVDGKPDVACVYFNASVTQKGVVPLIVGFADYKGQYAMLDKAEIRLFKQAANGKPKCADLKLDALPAADVVSPKVAIEGSFSFVSLPNLEADVTQTYTILALAQAGTGPTQATACNDVDGKVTWGQKKYVELTLADLAARIAASYDVTSTFDLVSGLPPAVSQVIYVITNFFENPAAELMVLLCTAGKDNGTIMDFCEYIFTDATKPDPKQLTATADVILDIVNAVLIGLLEANCPGSDPTLCTKIWFTGQDVSDILTHFELLSTITIGKEPDATGALKAADCKEVWHSVRLRWTLGLDCDPADTTCGWQKFSFSAIPGIDDSINGSFDGLYKDGTLTIDAHKLNLKYGALIDFTLEKWILPKLFGDGKDGLPAVDSFETALGALLAGRACLQDDSCCDTFAENVSGSTTSVTKNVVKAACTALIQTGSKYLRDQLQALDATPDNFTIGTKEPCQTVDSNKDMKIDALGSKEKQCVWDAKLTVGSTDYVPAGTFYGKVK
jgi:hypothetical protein